MAMDGKHHERSSRVEAGQRELAERIARVLPRDGMVEPLDGLRLHRVSARTELGHGVSFPALCVVAQGSKETRVGDRSYRDDPAHYLIVTNALPYATQITEASNEQPFLG